MDRDRTDSRRRVAARRLGRSSLGAVLLLAGLMAAGGCARLPAWTRAGRAPGRALSLHRFADPGLIPGQATQVVGSPDGMQRVCIQRLPVIGNREIPSGELVDTGRPERPAVRLHLDHQGAVLWMQTCVSTPGDSLAVLLDGFYWYALTIPRAVDTQSILLDGPIGRSEAEALVKGLPTRYREHHRMKRLF